MSSPLPSLTLRPMTIDDYDEVFAMWQLTSRRALSDADSRESIDRYLKRNPGMSQVAVLDGRIVGTVLCGHDGRRGFIHHMAVMSDYRRHGIAGMMAGRAIDILRAEGIDKTHIFCYTDNGIGQSFWSSLGFTKRNDVFVYSCANKNK